MASTPSSARNVLEQNATDNPTPESSTLQSKATSQPKSNVHKKLEEFLRVQKAEMANSLETTSSSEGQNVQAKPYDGVNPGGPLSFAYKSGDARVAHVPCNDQNVADRDDMPEAESSSDSRTEAKVEEEK